MLPIMTVTGNIGRMELRYTSSGKALMKFQVECSEKNSKGEYQNLYLDGECWEKQAEFVNQYFNDGDAVTVTGKLYTNVYEKDGKKVYQNKLLFPNVGFVPKPKAQRGQQSQAPQQQAQSYQAPQQQNNANTQPQRYNNQAQEQMPDKPQSLMSEIDDSEIPFGYIGLQYPMSLFVI